MYRISVTLLALGAWLVLASKSTCQEPLYLHAGSTVSAMAFSPDGNFLAAAAMGPAEVNPIVVWEVATGKEYKVLREHATHVHLLWWAPDAATLLGVNTSPGGGEIKRDTAIVTNWNVAARKDKKQWELAEAGFAYAVSPDGKLLVTVHRDSLLVAQIWNLETGKQVTKLKSEDGFMLVVFSADSKVLVTAGGGSVIKVWDTTKFEEQTSFKAYKGMRSLCVSPKGDVVVSQDQTNSEAEVWDINGKDVKRKLLKDSKCDRFAFSPDGKLLAGNRGGRGKLMFWDMTTRKVVAEVPIKELSAQTMMFSPDGQIVAMSFGTGKVVLVAVPAVK